MAPIANPIYFHDPALGRFITEDPAKHGNNWYSYVGNNPINRIDPSGLFWEELKILTKNAKEGFIGLFKSHKELIFHPIRTYTQYMSKPINYFAPAKAVQIMKENVQTSVNLWKAAANKDYATLGRFVGERAAIGVEMAVTYGVSKGVSTLADKMTAQMAENVGNGVNPKQIRYTQDSISSRFKDGTPLNETIKELTSGNISPDSIPSIRTFEQNGLTYSLDNRRLFVFQEAGVKNINTIPATPAEIANEAWWRCTLMQRR